MRLLRKLALNYGPKYEEDRRAFVLLKGGGLFPSQISHFLNYVEENL